MKDYPINIFYSKDDKGHVADIPDLKSCSAIGETAQEALREVLIAKKLWLEVARQLHKPIPKPSLFPQPMKMRKRKPILTNGKPIRSSKNLKPKVRRIVV